MTFFDKNLDIQTTRPSFVDKEDVFSEINVLEKEFLSMKRIICILDAQIQAKDLRMEKCLKEVESLKGKIEGMSRRKTSFVFRNSQISHLEKTNNDFNEISSNEFINFAKCMALTIEELL